MQYNIYRLVECSDYQVIYGLILLNTKHDIDDFQAAIAGVKERFFEKDITDWTIEDVFQNEAFNAFDYEYIRLRDEIIEI